MRDPRLFRCITSIEDIIGNDCTKYDRFCIYVRSIFFRFITSIEDNISNIFNNIFGCPKLLLTTDTFFFQSDKDFEGSSMLIFSDYCCLVCYVNFFWLF